MLMYARIKKFVNQKQKMKQNTKNFHISTLRALSVIVVISVFAIAAAYVPTVRSATLQQQIDELNSQNAQKQNDKNALGAQANDLSAEITKLQAEINAAQAKITENENEMARLQGEIKKAEDELTRQRGLLGDTIRTMYVEGDISTVEMLATSKDLSDFFDKQQYRESVRSKIKTTVDKITTLKLELNKQKEIVTKLLEEQKQLQAQLASQKADRDAKLAMNQSDQDKINAEMKANSGRIAELRRQQAAENAKLFKGGAVRAVPDSSGYPWANYRAGSWTHAGSCYYGDDIDPWGLCYRQCVSYAAWKTYKTKGYMPYGFGDAKNWDDRASARGIDVDGSPRAGDIAVSNSGTWGHVMYVESVNPNGTINISQYNVKLTGEYSEATISASGLRFIHF